jgi:hypothetical protein
MGTSILPVLPGVQCVNLTPRKKISRIEERISSFSRVAASGYRMLSRKSKTACSLRITGGQMDHLSRNLNEHKLKASLQMTD